MKTKRGFCFLLSKPRAERRRRQFQMQEFFFARLTHGWVSSAHSKKIVEKTANKVSLLSNRRNRIFPPHYDDFPFLPFPPSISVCFKYYLTTNLVRQSVWMFSSIGVRSDDSLLGSNAPKGRNKEIKAASVAVTMDAIQRQVSCCTNVTKKKKKIIVMT